MDPVSATSGMLPWPLLFPDQAEQLAELYDDQLPDDQEPDDPWAVTDVDKNGDYYPVPRPWGY